MTDREKLIEILMNMPIPEVIVMGQRCGKAFATMDFIADHLIANGVTFQKWIPVSEQMPKEHDSIFKRLYGTKDWLPGMFRTTSVTVLASIEKEDGTRTVKAICTKDGKWYLDNMPWAKKVTHWMPPPEPPKEE